MIPLPPDPTREDIEFLELMVLSLYRRLPDPIDKFIVAMHYEIGYSKSDVAEALGISAPAITQRDKKIKAFLQESYKGSRKLKSEDEL